MESGVEEVRTMPEVNEADVAEIVSNEPLPAVSAAIVVVAKLVAPATVRAPDNVRPKPLALVKANCATVPVAASSRDEKKFVDVAFAMSASVI